MAGLLQQARRLIGKKTPTEPPPAFSIRCPCGQPVEGYRRRDYQVVACPYCGGSIFVLPRSPLPTPIDSPIGRARPEPATIETVPRRRARAAPQSPTRSRRSAPAGPTLGERLARLRPPAHWFTRRRLIFAGVAAFVFLTAWWQVHRWHLNSLRENLVPRARRGLQALADGDFHVAHENLQFAVDALDRLNEPFPEAARYRQAFGEVAIVHDLLSESVEAVLYAGPVAAELISAQLQNRAIIIDAEVEPAGPDDWNVGYVAFLGDIPVPLDVRGFQLFHTLDIQTKTRVVFGARFEGLVQRDNDQWRLRLVPTSGVMLTEARIFDDLGLSRDLETAKLRDRQRALAWERLGIDTATGL